MKRKNNIKKLGVFLIIAIALVSCDKIKNPYKPVSAGNTPGTSANDSTNLDTTLYPGNWNDYLTTVWPSFSPNTNANRNVLIEDFTGHKCPNCPAAAVIAQQIETDNPGRVFTASIHAGPSATGLTDFQETDTDFPEDFTNPQGLGYGIFFYNGYGFAGNPRGPVNRTVFGTDFMFTSPTSWTANATNTINDNVLAVNIQAIVNYYPTTHGMYLHTEVEALTDLPASARLVVYFIQDEVIAPQKNGPVTDPAYHHHDIHRGNIDEQMWGQALLADGVALLTGKKARLNYAYKIPDQYDPATCHLLIYVMNNDTKEVYQVIKQAIL